MYFIVITCWVLISVLNNDVHEINKARVENLGIATLAYPK